MTDNASHTQMSDASGAGFALDPRLAADCVVIGELALSRLLLMNDSRYDWLILVPRRADLAELIDLDEATHAVLSTEIRAVSQALLQQASPFKINVAALGNVVRQLHVHVIGRRENDAAWPGPVWGVGAAQPYAQPQLEQACGRWRQALDL